MKAAANAAVFAGLAVVVAVAAWLAAVIYQTEGASAPMRFVGMSLCSAVVLVCCWASGKRWL